jgi:glycosyltransferase involved in cell wall biosynthesis
MATSTRGATDLPSKPILTIVTINLNNAHGLSETISSLSPVKNSELVELVFIDGDSSDNSLEIAGGFGGFKICISEADSGIYSAMNKGLRAATGKFVLWLNSGDRLFSVEALEQCLLHLENTKADIMSFNLIMCSDCGKVLETMRSSDLCSKLPNGSLPHPSTIFLREAVEKAGGYDESYKIAGDRKLILELFFGNCKIETPDILLSVFFVGGASSTRYAHYEYMRVDRHFGLVKSHAYYAWLVKYQAGTVLRELKSEMRSVLKGCRAIWARS